MGKNNNSRKTDSNPTSFEATMKEARSHISEARDKLTETRGITNNSKSNDYLHRILEISRKMNSTLELDSLLDYVIDKLIEFFQAERGFCILLDKRGKMSFKVAHNLDGESIDTAEEEISTTIIDRVIRDKEPVFVKNAMDHEIFGDQISVLKLGLKSVMCAPLIARDKMIGVIYVDNRAVTGQFSESDMQLLVIFANQAAIAIENAQLFQNLESAYEDLKSTQEQLIQVEKLRALGQMAGGIAHDFNNVLAAILGRVQLLIASSDDEDLKSKLKIVETAALDGAQTVRRIQEFTRKRTDENFFPIQANEIVKEAINITKTRWKDESDAQGICIRVETDLCKTPLIYGNDSDLRQVLTNIIFNAIDAMPNGGTIKIRTGQVEDAVVISVADTGVGMSDEVRLRVFDPFFTTKGVKGSGLGMSTAYGIIARHQGEILIESKEGVGSTFTIKLPIHRSAQRSEGKQEVTKIENLRGKILLIEDEKPVRDLLADVLRSAGHEVSVAPNGREGLEIFNKGKFDLVLTDLGMPDISGWEVARSIKDTEPTTIVILVTGWGIQISEGKIKENGIDRVVNKPFEVEDILKIVAESIAPNPPQSQATEE